MNSSAAQSERIRSAWQGRICGCILGKPLELLSFREGVEGVRDYLQRAQAIPLRSYVPRLPNSAIGTDSKGCCLGEIERAEADDDINYSVLALQLLEEHGADLSTTDVARGWLRRLPAGTTWTAEREAYKTLLNEMDSEFVNGAEPGFDLAKCSDNEFNDWIGAQIRADVYGWVCPGQPELAAKLVSADAALSHRADGVDGAAFVAALGAAIPATEDFATAVATALAQLPPDSGVVEAVQFGMQLEQGEQSIDALHRHFADLSPIHTLNNVALVVWALNTAEDDFSTAIGNAVAAGWDTDCNGATVGGLFGLMGHPIPDSWTQPWAGRVAVDIAGASELQLDELVARTTAVATDFAALRNAA